MNMKKLLLLLGAFAVLAPLAIVAGCGEKVSKEESEALKNASNVAAPKGGPAENPSKPKMAPPPP
jgi:ABC-type oligopeptide transport system substrate-binding subunit